MLQNLIEELMLADATLDADGYKSWCSTRLAISQTIALLVSQNSGNALVIDWQDFKERKPSDGDKVVIANFSTNQSTVMVWGSEFDYLVKEGDMWMLSPA